jgi:hypothetical protein
MTLEIIAGADYDRANGTDYNRANGADYKSAPAVLINIVCELGEAKSAPAVLINIVCKLGEANRPKGARRRQIRASGLN